MHRAALILCLLGFTAALEYRIGAMTQLFLPDGDTCNMGKQEQAAILLAVKHVNNRTDGFYDHLNVSFLLSVAAIDDRLETALQEAKYLRDASFGNAGVEAVIADTVKSVDVSFYTFNERALPQIYYEVDVCDMGESIRQQDAVSISPSQYFAALPIIQLMQRYEWSRVGIFSSNTHQWRHALASFTLLAHQENIHIASIVSHTHNDLHKHFSTMQQLGLKIFIIYTDVPDAARVLIEGYRFGLFTEGTQIIGSGSLSVTELAEEVHHHAPDIVHDVLKGFLTVKHRISLQSQQGKRFVQAWRSQQSVTGVNSDGSTWCSNATDNDGRLIYQHHGICTALTDEAICHDDIYPSAALAYDATIALATALNSLQNHNQMRSEFYSHLINNTFAGATGKISFSGPSSPLEQGYRISGIVYDIHNYQYGDCILVGNWTSEDGVTMNCNLLVFNTKTGEAPRVKNGTVLHTMHLAQVSAICLLAVPGLVSVLAVFALVYYCREVRLVRVTQPLVMLSILAAVWMGFLRSVIGLFAPDVTTCASGMWLEHVACSLVLTAVAAKVWRVDVILHSGMKKVTVSKSKIALVMSTIMLFVVLLLVWVTVMYPFHVQDIVSYNKDGDAMIERKCSQSGALLKPPVALLFVVHAFLLGAGMYYAYATRDVKSNIESAQRTTSVLTFILMLYIGGVAVEFGTNRSPTNTHFIRLFMIAIMYWKVFLAFFGHLTYAIISGYELNSNFDLSRRTAKVTNVSCDVSVDLENSQFQVASPSHQSVRAAPSPTNVDGASSISIRIDTSQPLSSEWRRARASPMFTSRPY